MISLVEYDIDNVWWTVTDELNRDPQIKQSWLTLSNPPPQQTEDLQTWAM